MKRRARKWLLIGLGWALVLGGVVLLPLPGPGLLVVAAGAYLLSRHSAWARARLESGRRLVRRRWPEGYRRLERMRDEARHKRSQLRELLRRSSHSADLV